MGDRKEHNSTGFAARLKELREEAGMSQSALAEAAGMNLWGIAKLEQGTREPSWHTVLALADALGVSTEEFRPVNKSKKK